MTRGWTLSMTKQKCPLCAGRLKEKTIISKKLICRSCNLFIKRKG